MKKVIIFILTLSLIVIQGIYAEETSDRESIESLSIEQYNNLLTAFGVDEEGEIIYPSYYAGAYIEKSGKLVVAVIDDHSSIKKEVKDITKCNDIKIKKVKKSYIDLVSTQKLIDSNYDYFSSLGLELVSVSKDIENNAVIAELRNLDKDSLKIIEKKFKGLDIEFRVDNSKSTDDVTQVKPGARIYEDGTTSYFTVGFPAKQNRYVGGVWIEVEGFVTCGHEQQPNDGIRYGSSSGQLVGYVKTIALSGDTDASFVETNYNGTPVNTLVNGYKITYATTFSYPPGTSVKMYGTTSLYQEGTIIDSSASGSFPSGYFTDIVKCDYTADGGDSGAPIFIGSGNYCTLIGIHKGRTGGYPHFVKYSNIKNRLGVTAIVN